MPSTKSFPFRRVAVDHAFQGATRVWWQLDPDFTDPGPHLYQLQVGQTGLPDATDWVNVGAAAENIWYAEDDVQRITAGKQLTTHYRVILTTPLGTYVSTPAPCWGTLSEHDWLFARELIRKEQLRLGIVGDPGILLKRRRFGARCTQCLDPMTKEVTDSRCPLCRGTGFLIGYHAPLEAQCWDVNPEPRSEHRGAADAPGESQPTFTTARVMGFPDIATEDVWVDGGNGQRWYVQEVTVKSAWRGVPLILDLTLALAPYTDAVYRVQIGGEPQDNAMIELPGAGAGSVPVTHDYGGEDVLAYRMANGIGIDGATVLAFTRADYAAGVRAAQFAAASTTTLANGRWSYALMLNPGDYTLVYEKIGEWGPDAKEITVESQDGAPVMLPPPPLPGQPPKLKGPVPQAFAKQFGTV